MKQTKKIGLTLAIIMITSIFAVLPFAAVVQAADPLTPPGSDNPLVSAPLDQPPYQSSLRVYGEDDLGPWESYTGKGQVVYTDYTDPFDPAALQKDSVTFNPAIVKDGQYGDMFSTDSQDTAVKVFMRLWYEPEHVYTKPHYIRETIEVETTYMLVDVQDGIPCDGRAYETAFVFPIVELEGQTGLAWFENALDPVKIGEYANLTYLVGVSGTAPTNYSKTTEGTIDIQKEYNLAAGDEVQFLDHKLMYNYIVVKSDGEYAKVTVSYMGNIGPDSARTVDLGVFDDGTPRDAEQRTYFDRHNNRYVDADHSVYRTWYAEYGGHAYDYSTATIRVGKELAANDTFYVNAVRYDIPAVEVIDTTGDSNCDSFKYITLRTPLPKTPTTSVLVADDGKVSSQWIDTINTTERIPVLPPFNIYYYMVDDINVVLWEPNQNTDEWPVGDDSDKKANLGTSYFPWAERYLTMQEQEIMAEEQYGLPVGANWFAYFGPNPEDMKINTNLGEDEDQGWIAGDMNERILPVQETPLIFCYVDEDDEPRYDTYLLEKLHEEYQYPEYNTTPLETWTWFDIDTKPDEYTAFALPARGDIVTPEWSKTGDYVLTTSFLAPNSINVSNLGPLFNQTELPRMAFAYDVANELDVTGSLPLMGDGLDIYVNKRDNVSSSVRIYGEDDIGPIGDYEDRGHYTYENYQYPFHPGAIRKDSITFNPAIIENSDDYPMSAFNEWREQKDKNIDVKKFLRIWYEPEHKYSKNTEWGDAYNATYPTIEVESTYMMIDSQDKLPCSGQAEFTFFAFPIAEIPGQPGLGAFENAGAKVEDKANLVKLAYVDGTVAPYNKTVYNNATIWLEKTYDLAPNGAIVQFGNHKLQLEDKAWSYDNRTWGKVRVWYAGNLGDGAPKMGVLLGEAADDPFEKTWFDRHNGEFATSDTDRRWYAQYKGASATTNNASITIGMEFVAGDVFYVNGVRYDVPAIEVLDGDGNVSNGAELFKYITLRTPLPKRDGIRVTTDFVADWGDTASSQDLVTYEPGDILPVDPPFNMEHYIVDDIGVEEGEYTVEERIIGPYDALEITYISEAIEPRYSTNLLEILIESITGTAAPEESWTKFDIATRPDQYTEFVLPGDKELYNFTTGMWESDLHNDYLITTAYLAPNANDTSNLDDLGYYIPRMAFEYDAINLDGIYINEIVGDPFLPGQGDYPEVICSVTPSETVSGEIVTACVSAEHWIWPLEVTVYWGDGAVSAGVLADNVTPVCFEHVYTEKGLKTVTQTARDIYDRVGVNDTTTVNITNDGFRLTIKPGWNLISIPVNDTITLDDLLDMDTNLWNDGAWYYDGGWVHLTSKTDRLYPKYGYFVYGPPSGTYEVVLAGTAEGIDKSWWVSGWNLVGPGYWPETIAEWGYWWNSDIWAYQWTHTLEPGRGYWVKLI